ncbi:MAG: NAD-dependent epimerase/dehydratase family protein, partial [Promethearchaeota archaeon]
SYEQNVTGTLNILEIMRQKGIANMVFASSGGTLYGDVQNFPTDENTRLKPISPYGASKAAAEMYLSAYAVSYNLRIASTRYANIYGPWSNHGVMFDFFNKLEKNPNKLVILGDGKQSKSYLYVSDCVNATVMIGDWLVRQERGIFETFNIGSPDWISVTEIAKIMVELLGLENVRFEYTGGNRGWVGDVPKVLLDTKKINKVIGWTNKVDIRKGMKMYIEFLKQKKI